MPPTALHIPTRSTRNRNQRLSKLKMRLIELQERINILSAKRHLLLNIPQDSPPTALLSRSERIQQRSDLIFFEAHLQASKFRFASTEFEIRYLPDAKPRNWMGGGGGKEGMYTEEMVKDLWGVLVKALRFEEEVQVCRDGVGRLGRDFSEDGFWMLRGRMWLMGVWAKKLVREWRGEVRKGERGIGRKKGGEDG